MDILGKIQIHQDKLISDAIEVFPTIKELSRIILFVIDDNNKVVGTLTDGDIRRSLIENGFINKNVGEICNKEFDYIHNANTYQNFQQYLERDIVILPVLNKENQLTQVIDLKEVKARLPIECMIMAGGRGKRLSPLTDTIPKPMLPLGDKPIIEHNIDRLISYGIKKIYISIKYRGEQIQEYFGDGSSKGIHIEYISEEIPLGTAGALSLVDNFETENILLLNSDLFTNTDFESMYLKMVQENADMVIASTEYKIDVPYAIFNTQNDKVNSFQEKPSIIYQANAGIYLLKKELINKIPKNEFYDITSLMQDILDSKGKVLYDPIIGYWIDIGKPVDYQQAQEFIKHFN